MFKLLTTAALLLTASIAPASAEPSRKVGFSDLDLATAQGQARLDDRVRSAVRSICAESYVDVHQRNICRRQMSEAAQLKAGTAIARYQARAATRVAGR